LQTIQRLAAERDELRIVNDQIGTPTWTRQIAETTASVLAQCWESGSQMRVDRSFAEISGIYHLTAAGQTSWHGFAKAIIGGKRPPATKDKPTSLVEISTREYPTPAKRPAWSVLDNSKLQNTFGIVAPDWQNQLDQCLRQTLR
jgi:dTDP-4-dehydrorhamnose reductase